MVRSLAARTKKELKDPAVEQTSLRFLVQVCSCTCLRPAGRRSRLH